MTSIIATLFVLTLLILMPLAGYRDGLFFSTYALVRNLFAFICAMVFSEKLAGVFEGIFTDAYPAHEYFTLISFALIFALVFMIARRLKMQYTIPHVQAIGLVDKIAGPIVGFLNAVIMTGTVLIFASMLPFAKYAPGDMGHFSVRSPKLDTGVAMLRVFDYLHDRMQGGRFPLDPEPLLGDANGNGRADPGEPFDDQDGDGVWDRGWLWRYRDYAEIRLDDLDLDRRARQ